MKEGDKFIHTDILGATEMVIDDEIADLFV